MTTLISLQDLYFRYAGQPTALLKGASIEISPGERVALSGGNGAGKSTLLRLMTGLEKPSRGEIFAFGAKREQEKDFLEVRLKAGFVFQYPDDQLFCPTVAEDIAFGPLNQGKSHSEVRKIVDETLRLLNLLPLKDYVTHKLSGGQKRLVALASVMALQPEVLLLDEPTNDLDRESKQHLIQILTSLPQALLIISHSHHFLNRVATRHLSLEEGKIHAIRKA